MRNANTINSISQSITYIGQKMMLFGCLLIYVILGNELDAATVFVLLSSFNAIVESLIGNMLSVFHTLSTTRAANEKIQVCNAMSFSKVAQ